MPAHLYVSPAATGKTAWAVDYVRQAAHGLQRTPIVVVPTPLQAHAFRARLAYAGGAIGVRVLTFDDLHVAILQQAGELYTELAEPVLFRLIRAVIDRTAAAGALPFHQPLATSPGFVQVLQGLIELFKGAAIEPETLGAVLPTNAEGQRLRELVTIYAGYQQLLREHAWSDRAGMGWLARDAVRRPHVALPATWAPVVFDGFDSYTQVQLDVIAGLAAKASELIVTLTGTVASANGVTPPRAAHKLYTETAARLRNALDISASPLPPHPNLWPSTASGMHYLADRLFEPVAPSASDAQGLGPSAGVTLLEATNRATEVRAALRWLKTRLIYDGMALQDVALLARSLDSYRDIIGQVAAEFGMPVRILDGLPLNRNPAVLAVMELLRLALPDPQDGRPALPRRTVLEAWNSPYFDWSQLAPDRIGSGIEPGDRDLLAEVARAGQVIRGEAQWLEALERLSGRPADAAATTDSEATAEETSPAAGISPAAAQALSTKFQRFVAAITPPTASTMRDFVCWLEDLIGADPTITTVADPAAPGAVTGFTLSVVACARRDPPATVQRDLAALQALKDVLRGLVWSEETLGKLDGDGKPVDFVRFFTELSGAVDAASCFTPQDGQSALLVATTLQARGLPFRAVAILGLAEGELPLRITEDPFLRDADRVLLQQHELPIELSTRSLEREYFYDTVARAREQLLITRPRLMENGAEWEPSPYWNDLLRLLAPDRPQQVTAGRAHGLPASVPELVQHLARTPAADALAWLAGEQPARWRAVEHGAAIVVERKQRPPTRFDGDLVALSQEFTTIYGSSHTWSASRLEQYLTCGFFFLTASVLTLAPRREPEEGLDATQLGAIYHAIFEQVYRSVSDPTDLTALVANLPQVAARILRSAPQWLGFRRTAWWAQECAVILDHVERSLIQLHALSAGYTPIAFEQYFGGEHPLLLEVDGDTLAVRGVIDRIDRNPDSGALRIIDYKTGSVGFDARGLRTGKKIQLPIYALAAELALRLGAVEDGFYWLIRRHEPGPLHLHDFDGGVTGAEATALQHIAAAVHGVRRGEFAPTPPADGCPQYCPATAFCWRYLP